MWYHVFPLSTTATVSLIDRRGYIISTIRYVNFILNKKFTVTSYSSLLKSTVQFLDLFR